MKYVKFTMSSGEPITLQADKAERLINDPKQLLMIYDDNGQWTGKTINKAHIVSTDRDIEKERSEVEQERLNVPKLKEVKNPKAVREAINKVKKDLFKNKIINKPI